MSKILCITILLLFSVSIWSAPGKNIKIQLKQPNGEIINCLATGDEYYSWAHDSDNFTIIQDSVTGYFCYAIIKNDKLIASPFIVGKYNPKKYGLIPGVNISSEKIFNIRHRGSQHDHVEYVPLTKNDQTSLKSVTIQTMNNIVVYIRFSDQTEFPSNHSFYNTLFNSSTTGINSLHNYFKEVSYNSLYINSHFFPINNGTNIVSYKDSHKRDYYRLYSPTNDSGYTSYSMRCARELELLKNATNYIVNQVPTNINFDLNNDGEVDNICFIIRGGIDLGYLLSPHKSYMSGIYINSLKVHCFNLQIEDDLLYGRGNSVLCHEMYHSFGAVDYYNYYTQWYPITDDWDIMSTINNPPPSMCAYSKYKYGKWISSIPEITQSGHYSLNPITSSTNNCYKISSPNNSEFFVLEFRKKTGTFESSIDGTGLLIYRINNSTNASNTNGPPFAVYAYRKDGIPGVGINDWGEVYNAHFDTSVGRSSFHNSSNPYCFLSDGSPGNIFIKNIVTNGNTVSFDVRFCDGVNVLYSNTNQLPYYTNALNKIETSGNVIIKGSDNITFEAGQEILINGDFEIQPGGSFDLKICGCGNQ